MSIKTKIPAGYTFIEGRSAAKAQELLDALSASGVEGAVRTTSSGYLVPEGVLGAGAEAQAAAADADADAGAEVQAQTGAEAQADAAAADAGADADENENGVQFDPATAKVDEVLEYLAGADDEERARVLDAEKAGQNRVTITREYEEGAK